MHGKKWRYFFEFDETYTKSFQSSLFFFPLFSLIPANCEHVLFTKQAQAGPTGREMLAVNFPESRNGKKVKSGKNSISKRERFRIFIISYISLTQFSFLSVCYLDNNCITIIRDSFRTFWLLMEHNFLSCFILKKYVHIKYIRAVSM